MTISFLIYRQLLWFGCDPMGFQSQSVLREQQTICWQYLIVSNGAIKVQLAKIKLHSNFTLTSSVCACVCAMNYFWRVHLIVTNWAFCIHYYWLEMVLFSSFTALTLYFKANILYDQSNTIMCWAASQIVMGPLWWQSICSLSGGLNNRLAHLACSNSTLHHPHFRFTFLCFSDNFCHCAILVP